MCDDEVMLILNSCNVVFVGIVVFGVGVVVYGMVDKNRNDKDV